MLPDVLPTEGPPRYYLPICVLTPVGWYGGPANYKEVTKEEADRGPIIGKPIERL